MSGFWKAALRIGAQEAPAILSAINPAAGALAQVAIRAIITAEAKHGAGNGEIKKQTAMESMGIAAPLAMILLQASGRTVNEEQFAEGISKITDGFVEVLNASGILPRKGQ